MNPNILLALKAFEKGQLVAMPTETVYGLAAPINQPALIERIFELKQRPFFDPLIVHVSSVEQAKSLCSEWPETAEILAQNFWPGPLTLVLPKKETVSDLITSGLPTIGIRMPGHPLALELIQELGVPVAAPSANLFQKTSPTQASHVADAFSDTDVFVLDGGPCDVGIESSIFEVTSNSLKLLRPGHIQIKDLQALGLSPQSTSQSSVLAPGMMEDHYMPNVPLVLVSEKNISQLESLLSQKSLSSAEVIHLNNNPVLTARELYMHLRMPTTKACLVIPIAQKWLMDPNWEAVLDRLKKAASVTLL